MGNSNVHFPAHKKFPQNYNPIKIMPTNTMLSMIQSLSHW
jgi:hypothetical protein